MSQAKVELIKRACERLSIAPVGQRKHSADDENDDARRQERDADRRNRSGASAQNTRSRLAAGLIPSGPMETAIEQLDISPDRSFSYDGRFIISRVTDKDGNLVRELRYDAGLADWVPMPIKHGKRKGGIRVVIRFTPVAGSPRNNEMFDVAASDADAVTAWLDRLVKRH